MCKTYDAIFEIRKCLEKDILVACIEGAKIRGSLNLEEECKKMKNLEGVIVLKDATVTCKETNEEKHFPQLQVATPHIKTFYFE